MEWWSGTECTLYTDPESFSHYGKENAIVVLNHNFEIDFMCGWIFCDRFGVLGVRQNHSPLSKTLKHSVFFFSKADVYLIIRLTLYCHAIDFDTF